MSVISKQVEEGGLTRFHWRIEFVGAMHLLLGSICVGLLSFVFAQLVLEWDLTPWHVGVISVANAIATGIGALVVGSAVDRLGRRPTMRLSLLVVGIGTVLSAFSWDPTSLTAFQFIAGLGLGGIAPSVSVFIGEFAPSRYRGSLSALTEAFWGAGWLVAVGAAYIIIPRWGWRAAFLFGGVSLVYVAIQGRLAPESPRFLLERGRKEEADKLLTTLRERHGVVLNLPDGSTATRPSTMAPRLRDLWSRPLARRTACAWVLWFVLVFTYWGIFAWTPALLSTSKLGVVRTFEFSFFFTAVQLPAVALAVLLIDRIGRKWLLVSTLFVCGVASYMFGLSTEYSDFLIWGGLVSASNIIGWAVMLAYTPELFPTRLRGTASGWASAFGRLGGLSVPVAIAVIMGSWSTGHQLVFFMFAGVLIAGAVLMSLLAEETKGRTLEEISARL